MKRLLKILWPCFLAFFAFVAASPGQGGFSVDGLAVDTLGAEDPLTDAASVDLREGLDALSSDRTPAEPTGYFAAELPRDAADYEKYRAAEAAARESAAAYRDVIASARQYIARGEWASALRNIELALQDSPDSPYLLQQAAVLYSLGGEYESADKYFERYLKIKPSDVDSMAAWAAVALFQRQFQKAEALLNRTFELAPRNLSAHFHAVVFQVAAGRDKPLRPYDWHHLTLAEMFILSNWMEADRQIYEKLLGEKGFEKLIAETIGPVPVASLNEVRTASRHAMALRKREQWQSVRDILLRLQDLGVQSYRIPMALAQAHFNLGSPDEALSVLMEVQRRYPHLADAWQNSAFVRIKTGDYEKGLADAIEAQKLSPDNPDIQFYVICALAGAGRLDEMWPLFENWSRKNPKLFEKYLTGDEPFLQAIRNDPRYGDLLKTVREAAGDGARR